MKQKDNPFSDLSNEELKFLLDNPGEIETGCENNCEACIDIALSDIKRVLRSRDSTKESSTMQSEKAL